MADIPAAFIGAVEIRQPVFFGLLSRGRKIGMEFCRNEEFRTTNGVLQFDTEVNLFVMPPTLSILRGGIMEINLRDGAIKFTSVEGVELRGKLSDDRQSIAGHVDIQDFQLMNVAGDFFNMPVRLEAVADVDE